MPTNRTTPFSDDDATPDDALWTMLSAYADGEATPDEVTQVEALLQTNAEARRDLLFLQGSSRGLHTFGEVDAPAFLREAILSRTTQRPTLARRLASALAQVQSGLARPVGRLTLAGGAVVGLTLTLLTWPRPHTALPSIGHDNTDNIIVRRTEKPSVFGNGGSVADTDSKSRSSAEGLHSGSTKVATASAIGTKKSAIPASGKRNAPAKLSGEETQLAKQTAPPINPTEPRIQLNEDAWKGTAIKTGTKTPKIKTLASDGKPQMPAPLDRGDAGTMQIAYSPRPMMDNINKKPLGSGMDREGDDPISGPNVVVQDDSMPHLTGASVTASAEVDSQTSRPILVRRAHLSMVSTPPDSQKYLSSGDLQRDANARSLGYNRPQLQSIQRHEAAVMFGGRF